MRFITTGTASSSRCSADPSNDIKLRSRANVGAAASSTMYDALSSDDRFSRYRGKSGRWELESGGRKRSAVDEGYVDGEEEEEDERPEDGLDVVMDDDEEEDYENLMPPSLASCDEEYYGRRAKGGRSLRDSSHWSAGRRDAVEESVYEICDDGEGDDDSDVCEILPVGDTDHRRWGGRREWDTESEAATMGLRASGLTRRHRLRASSRPWPHSRRWSTASRSSSASAVRPRRRGTSDSVFRASAYRAYFRLVEEDPSEELAVVKDLTAPLIRSMPVTLPFDLSRAVADNCLSLSGMGYSLGVGSCCPTCTGRGEDPPGAARMDRAALILAYVQQVNDIFRYRVFMASIVALASRDAERRPATGGGVSGPRNLPPEERGADDDEDDRRRSAVEAVLAKVLARPELFFAYHVLRDGGVSDARVLFYADRESACDDYMMYVVFPGKSVHLHHRLLDRLQAACRGYRLVAHVWQTTFVLVVRRDGDRPTESEKVPRVNADDVYCKLCDLNIDGELLLDYARLYGAFDDFLPPR